MNQLAVLTGDIIESSALTADDLNDIMELISDATRSIVRSDLYHPIIWFSRRAGDGWQVAFAATHLALRTALHTHAVLAAHSPDIRTRIAIATGQDALDTTGHVDLNHAVGPVFTASGRALETMPHNLHLSYDGDPALSAVARLLDALCSGWTAAQARTVAMALAQPSATQSHIADALGVSRQNVAQTLKAAHYPAIRDALARIEER